MNHYLPDNVSIEHIDKLYIFNVGLIGYEHFKTKLGQREIQGSCYQKESREYKWTTEDTDYSRIQFIIWIKPLYDIQRNVYEPDALAGKWEWTLIELCPQIEV